MGYTRADQDSRSDKEDSWGSLSSFPKQSRADQDSRSDVDQTRREDDASGDSCGSGSGSCRPKQLTFKEQVDELCRKYGCPVKLYRSEPAGRHQKWSKNELGKIITFQLGGGDGGGGSTVADQGQGGSATTDSSGGAAK